jgi:carbonic anhydrase/acetyltransferase-like protein (isoleucine patch superfamily)
MSVYEFEGKRPVIGKGTYVFDSADVIGDVTIGKDVYIGAGARIRGDYGTIHIGDGSAVEDNVVIHARPDDITRIGKNVPIGHGAVIHNCTIKDNCVIGMNSVVSDWAELGEWVVVGEGAVVRNKQVLEPDAVVVGVPAKVIARVDDKYKEQWTSFKGIYSDFARKRYPESLKKIDWLPQS